MVIVEIAKQEIIPFPSTDDRCEEGAELVFNGRVREYEDGNRIIGLEYEQYESMAKFELTKLAKETCKKFPINDLFVKHRIGEVGVGETSLHVAIWSKHREEALKAMDWFIFMLKKHVPIWKWAIHEDGTKVPSECTN